MSDPTARAEYLARRLSGWANQAIMRFGSGTHVYLVGSFLSKQNPRDIDITIVVPDDLFWVRYRAAEDVERVQHHESPDAIGKRHCPCCGAVTKHIIADWNQHSIWTPDMLRYGREVARMTTQLMHDWGGILGQHEGVAHGFVVDLKVMPESEQTMRHKDKPRLQIDTIPSD